MTGKTEALLRCVFLLLFACVSPVLAAAAEDPSVVRRMMDAGATELAVTRIEALQPRDAAAPLWAEWEGLRCEALARLNRHAQLSARVKALPAQVAAALDVCFVEAARAALAQNEPQTARVHAARVLWQGNASAAAARNARLTVIESYIAERRGDDAFRSMLRFQQDYQPLDRATAERFAEALLDLGLDREAVNWLGRSDEVSPTRLRLQLRGATLAPEAVITQARAALVRNPDAGYWRSIHEAAVRSRNRSLEIEALERLLQLAETRNERAWSEAAQRLWQTYAATAGEIGNREQLLVGDDGAWADYGARRLGSDAYLSRAFYGYLAQRAQNADIRRNAQLQLAFSLYSAKLDYAALRLMQRIGSEVESLDAQTRYLLGTIASNHNEAELALRLWKGLGAPANVTADEWQIRLARTALQAGDAETSAGALKRMFAGRTGLSPELAQSALELAQEMLDLRKLDQAQSVYELVAGLTNDSRAREALFGLGRAYELKGDAVAAAGAYLRSALLLQGASYDALAFQARLLAAINLMRAGLKDDARAQFEWLLKNAKDPALIEAARRGLNRL